MYYVKIETNRTGYSPDQCGRTMTVEELIESLSRFHPEQKVYFSNDNGYTYGNITDWALSEGYDDEDE